MSTKIIVNSRKLSGRIHRSWEASLIYRCNDLIILDGRFSETVEHRELGIIEKDTISIEYFWLNRWFNVFRFQHPDGGFRNFYCNINTPPTLCGNVLDYTDLEIDVLVDANYCCRILDQDEFSQMSEEYNLSARFKIRVEQTISQLLNQIKDRKFPFSISNEELK